MNSSPAMAATPAASPAPPTPATAIPATTDRARSGVRRATNAPSTATPVAPARPHSMRFTGQSTPATP